MKKTSVLIFHQSIRSIKSNNFKSTCTSTNFKTVLRKYVWKHGVFWMFEIMTRLFSEQNLTYKITTVFAWTLTFFVLVMNVVAIVYFSTKKSKLRKNVFMNKFLPFRFSTFTHTSVTQPLYKPDEIIVLSLCASNLIVGLATAIDLFVFILETTIPYWLDTLIGYIVTFSILVSIIHILFLSLERLISTRYPFHHKQLKNSQTYYMLFIVWSMSILPAILEKNPRRSAFSLLLAALLVLSYIILIITYTYVLVKMDQTFKKSYENDDAESIKRQKELDHRATFTCCIIVISYILCTCIPVVKLLTHKGGVSHRHGERIDVTMFVFFLLRSLSDPFVYILRNKIYDFGMFLFKIRRKQRKKEISDYDLSFNDDKEFMLFLIDSRETCL